MYYILTYKFNLLCRFTPLPPTLYSEGQKGAASASGKSRGPSLQVCVGDIYVGDIIYTRQVQTYNCFQLNTRVVITGNVRVRWTFMTRSIQIRFHPNPPYTVFRGTKGSRVSVRKVPRSDSSPLSG